MSITFMEKFEQIISEFPIFQEIPINSFKYKLMYIIGEEFDKAGGNTNEFGENVKDMLIEIHQILLCLVITIAHGDYEKVKKLLSLLHSSEDEVLDTFIK